MDLPNYDVMSRVATGTFVPDLATPAAPKTEAIPTGDAAGASFKDTVKQILGDVNNKLTTADQGVVDLATGKTNNTQKVVTSVEEANLAMSFTIAIRNKLLEAYTEINRMQV